MATSSISQIPSRLRTAALSTLTTLDRTAVRLSTVLQTPAGIDKFFLTVYYTLTLLHPQISRLRALRSRRRLVEYIQKASPALIPGESLVALLPVSRTDDALAEVNKSMRAAVAMLSEFRMVMRLWGLLTMYRWARGTWLAPPADGLLKALTWGQIVTCTGYQALENVAYLAGKGILRGDSVSPQKQKNMWLWSCRFWTVYTGFEVVRLLRERQLREKSVQEKAEGEVVKSKEEEQAWWRSWFINAGYAPMAIHYSVDGGLLPEDVIGLLGVVVGYNSFGHMWKQTGRGR